jgi:glycosyltransferase involved in cell wall biosynthesis
VKLPLSVLIITGNEEVNIGQCVGSVVDWADEVVVVDSFSTDRTVEIARELGATVHQHEWQGYAAQKNLALDTHPWRNQWVFLLDADELRSEELKQEIASLLAEDGEGYDGYYIRWRFIFYGHWIRYCGWYGTWALRLFRHELGRFENRAVDEHLIVDGKLGRCKNDIIHRDLHDIGWWIEKHNRYATLNAIAFAELEKNPHERIPARLFGSQRERRRWIKENIWRHLPARGILLFLYLYVIRLGFLDGKKGLIFCSMHGIFEHMRVVKQWELREKQRMQAREGQAAVSTAKSGGAAE